MKTINIPRYIHQIWFPIDRKIPRKYNINIATIHKSIESSSNKWIYKCWNEKEIYNECSQYSQDCGKLFASLNNYNDKKKLAKYVILYNFGGIYLDMNCAVLKPLDIIPGLNSKQLIISFAFREYLKNLIFEGTTEKLINTSTILSSPKNIYIQEMINNIFKNNKKHESLLMTKILMKNKWDTNMLILDHKYFDPCHSLDSCCEISKKAIIDHKYQTSWLNSRIAWVLGCIFHLKEDYDRLISSLFSLLFITIIILQLFIKK